MTASRFKKDTAESIKARLRPAKREEAKPLHLSTGLTLLNLACSGRASDGIPAGHFILLVGDSQAGKSVLLRQMMAEVANDPRFKDYRIIDDNPERGMLMNVRKFFGKRLVERTEEPPAGTSATLEQMYDNVADAVADGRPFFYGLDSEDALPPEVEIKKAKADRGSRRNAKRKGTEDEMSGSYGTAKAKLNSSSLRMAHNGLAATGSIFVMIKQTRQNIGFGSQFNPKTRSGGNALTFYATCEVWFSVAGKIKRKVRGKQRNVGSYLKITVKKNRVSGKDQSVVIPFYRTHGFDEVGSMIDWLVEERHWKGNEPKDGPRTVVAPEFGWDGTREELTAKIELEGREKELRALVVETWNEIEEACLVTRKARYQ